MDIPPSKRWHMKTSGWLINYRDDEKETRKNVKESHILKKNAESRSRCKQAKGERVNKKCEEIERIIIIDKGNIHKGIKQLIGQKMNWLTSSIKSKEKENISKLERIR